ncbi:MAG: hypothetical protein ACLRFM_03715 [Alphaproteobacteria bacterium]
MKKILGGFLCAMLMITGANAATETTIRAATTNTVRKQVFNINYGAANDLDGRSYRKGVIPQTNELNTARGNTSANIDSVAVGNLPAAGTQTITANTANIAALERDKLVTPGSTGNCTTGVPCGYVTTGTHTNTEGDRVWLKIEGATVGSNTYYGELPSGN